MQVKGDDEEKEAIHNASLKSKFVTGARHPQWMQDLEEMGRNGTWAHLCPLPATALPYAQPTGVNKHTNIQLLCVLMLLYTCPHAPIYASSCDHAHTIHVS